MGDVVFSDGIHQRIISLRKTSGLLIPENTNNNVVDTLTDSERQSLSDEMSMILRNIDSDENFIKIYFPENAVFKESKGGGYKISEDRTPIPPRNERFG